MSDGKESNDRNSKPSVIIKTEGTPKVQNPLARLPSFRQPRDLTLGAGSAPRGGGLGLAINKSRKNYAPNLNVQRNKNKEEVKVKDETSQSRSKERGRGRGRGADRGRGDRGRGRGAGANVIQLSSGVFSEGIAAATRRSVRGGGGDHGESGTNYIPKPKIDLKQNYFADSKEEGERLKQLLQDNFIDDPDALPEGVKPLQLPMLPLKIKGGGALVKKEKEDPDLPSVPDLAVKIKKEPGEDDEEDTKLFGEDGQALYERSVGGVFGSREPEYILVQLPDCLPGLRPSTEAENGKNVNDSSQSVRPENGTVPQCTLSTLSEGLMGKIQLLRSGKARLNLGTVSLPISMGTQIAFRQDLISVNLDASNKTGRMINLGQVHTRMVVTPDWEAMLAKA